MTSLAFNMDCMDAMRGYDPKYFDLAVCDPPYFKGFSKMGYWGEKGSSLGVPRGQYAVPEWDEQIPDQKWLDEVVRVSKNQIIWGINYFRFYHCPGRIVWDKVTGDSPLSDAEIASCSFHDSTRMVCYMWNGMLQGKSLSEPRTMQGNKRLNEKRIHPTQKPVLLYDWIFQKYSAPGQRILDTHLGSGSSRIAADRAGLHFIGYEINTDNFLAQEKRWKSWEYSKPKLFHV